MEISSTSPLHASRHLRLAAIVLLTCGALMASACTTSGNLRTVEVPSANQDSRVNVLVLHHTSEDFQGSLNILTEPSKYPVSSHYLVPEPLDPSYDEEDLKVYALVPEEQRAWHAGSSYWKGQTKLNNVSVGIEIVNETYCHRAPEMATDGAADWPSRTICFFPDYPESQIEVVIDLVQGILERHSEIKPTHVVGHSDVAPQRKIDPGPRFPWHRLHQLGIGAWYDDETVIKYWEQFNTRLPTVSQMQGALQAYGYKIEPTGELDEQTGNVLRAFQHHFLPYRVSKEFTVETAAVLYALVEKYYPDELPALLPGA
ncbi:MAG: N-acetylmuramoyl-L-alanine amidase [Gammaproteobacteria bacterium]|nr:N-acetylmuramoyl-L-alanine amidase [Gammaproteobacteria bacterium]MBT8051230.1 N-acetylmuramoyl-L-alanine amidase [Gammaproteobacteria bacterium]MBT8057701.1 N-acetylmuramoyl-L-alanine amidase [Gammaproteobacteria bacterium]NNJ78475.1 N-acetylmuramoyl-L-alanine amidase [Xanthomonadales bacterium]